MHSIAKDKKIHSIDISDITEEMRKNFKREISDVCSIKLLEVEGMMCGHCEKMVKKTLEKFSQIEEAEADFQTGTVKIHVNGDVPEDEIRAAVEKAGYEYKGLKQEG